MRRGVALGLFVAVVSAGFTTAGASDGVRYIDEVFASTTVTSDLVYGQAVNYAGELETLRLDVHEPAGDDAALRPAYVWVHGGYFKRGDKASDYEAPHIESVTRAGYVVFSINYRLDPTLPEGAGPAVMEQRIDHYIDAMVDAQHDAQAAIRWVRANAAHWRVDPELVAIGGHSAGGITATMVAFNSDDTGSSGTPGYDSRVVAALSHAGGGAPVKHVRIDAGEPPMLFVHGLVDNVVPYPAAVMACAATVALLNVCEQVIDPDQGHGLFGPEYDRAFLHRWLIERPHMRMPVQVTLRP